MENFKINSMTIEEAVYCLLQGEPFGEMYDPTRDKVFNWDEAFDMAIKALKREDMLDKIRVEIEQQRKESSNKHSEHAVMQAYYDGLNDGLKDARDIIDKYRVESEV